MLGAVKYGLANITNFNGRDARQTFWYYVLFVYIINVLITMAVSVPLSIRMVGRTVRTATHNAGNDDAIRATVMSTVNDMTTTIMWVSVFAAVLMIVLLAASLVRRLHDSDLSGYWALLPAALQIAALSMIPSNVRQMTESMAAAGSGDPFANIAALKMQVGASAVIGWLPIVIVVLMGIRKSTAGPNRFGETSVSF